MGSYLVRNVRPVESLEPVPPREVDSVTGILYSRLGSRKTTVVRVIDLLIQERTVVSEVGVKGRSDDSRYKGTG